MTMVRSKLHHPHQTAFRMIQNVAVKHPHTGGAGPVVPTDDEAHRFLEWNVDCVFPCQRMDGLPVVAQHLEKEAVKMKRMRPIRFVLDGPDLCFADRCR